MNGTHRTDFSSGVIRNLEWSDGHIISSGDQANHFVYFRACCFTVTFQTYSVWIGTPQHRTRLQHWNGSGWQNLIDVNTDENSGSKSYGVNVAGSNGTYSSSSTIWRTVSNARSNYYTENYSLRIQIFGLQAHNNYSGLISGRQAALYSGSECYAGYSNNDLAATSLDIFNYSITVGNAFNDAVENAILPCNLS